MQKNILFFSNTHQNVENLANIKELLGNKGANLVEMSQLGIPIPPGFILSTAFCKEYSQTNDIDEQLIREQIQKLELITNQGFGSNVNPLLVSVRSGAVISMPGMMDTILNIGLNDDTVKGLANTSGDAIFAYDSYRRLIQMYGNVVLGIEHEIFHEILIRYNCKSLEFIQKTINEFKSVILGKTQRPFPQNVMEQLITSIQAVFESWNSNRARVYREKNNIDHNLSTAATVQFMVFGNMNENSCTGVLFSRNPISGEKALFGEFLPRAQGEDVVAGFESTYPLTILDAQRNYTDSKQSMEVSMPEVFEKLKSIAIQLEHHFGDMQDIEFTVQDGNLWILQTRNGKRSSAAAIKIAVDMVNEELKTEEQALKDLPFSAIEQSIHKQLILKSDAKILTKGLAASPGAASGVIALSSKRAEILAKNHSVILIRNETSPEDIAGMYAASGIITARGGVTSHAAVVARGIGKPCICSAEKIIIVNDNTVSINGITFHEGHYITMNGSTGNIYEGQMDMTPSAISNDFITLLTWMDKHKKISVFANAETPEDVRTAMTFGAEGIGLCRTEHMFFDSERINDVRKMILAKNAEERKDILKKLLQYQKYDFKELLKILNGKPICIRLLDPPLHEFLPQNESDIKAFCDLNGENFDSIKNIIQSLHEYNPMLGHRGVRLGITHSDIYECQVTAIFEAMIEYESESNAKAMVEIMIPLIFSENELIFIKNIIEKVKNHFTLLYKYSIEYKFGAMIELPRAALLADHLCKHVDFISFGTNDLTQTTFGVSRDDSSKFLNEYIKAGIIDDDPFCSIDVNGVGELIKIAVRKIRSQNMPIKIGVCGEHGGDQRSIHFFNDIELNYVSCSPYRVPAAKLTACTI